jgi:N,N'-diacetyllegionaminate synthase
MKIGQADTSERVLVVAEIGNNHEGDPALAAKMVRAAATAGADAVKFQTIRPERLVRPSETARLAQLRRFALDDDDFARLARTATEAGVLFLSTPFDPDAVAMLDPLVPAFKVASADNTHFPLLDAIARTGKPVILGGGLASLEELAVSVDHIRGLWRAAGVAQDIAVLHCVTAYPAPPEEVNLRVIPALRDRLDCEAGYSDHTLGIEAAVAAVALGARIVEKHFTLDKTRDTFRDHALSADPEDLAEMVRRIRMTEIMLGTPEKTLRSAERASEVAARRSIVARRDLSPGTVLSMSDFDWLRPGDGLPPGQEHRLVGKSLRVAKRAGDPFDPEDIA